MKNKIRAMRPIILLLLVFATLASCVVTAGAIGWSGSTTTGGVASSSTSGGVMQVQLSGNYDKLQLTSTENILY